MSTRPIIVVGYDSSEDAEAALVWATRYAKATEGSLKVISAWEWPTYGGEPLVYANYDPAKISRDRLERAVSRIDLPGEHIDYESIQGHPAHVLMHESETADLMVLGWRGLGGFATALLGSVSAACAQHAPCPVAIVRPSPADAATAGVLVGVDGSQPGLAALRWAMDYAELAELPLTVTECVHPEPIAPQYGYPVTYDRHAVTKEAEFALHDLVDKEIADRGRPLPKGYTTLVIEGKAAPSLIEQSRTAALTVVGRRGIGGFRRLLLGSTSSALAHHAHGTVVITPAAAPLQRG